MTDDDGENPYFDALWETHVERLKVQREESILNEQSVAKELEIDLS